MVVRNDPENLGEAVREMGAPVWGELAEVLVPLLRIAMGVPVRTRRQLTVRRGRRLADVLAEFEGDL